MTYTMDPLTTGTALPLNQELQEKTPIFQTKKFGKKDVDTTIYHN